MRSAKLRIGLIIASGFFGGAAVAVLLMITVLQGEAQREDFAENAEFIKRGRADLAVCVSDLTDAPTDESFIADRVAKAIDENKRKLWDGTFLESEPFIIQSPCPIGPTVDANTPDVMEYIADFRIVAEPGPYAVYVYVVPQPYIDALDNLNLGRVIPQEFIDPDPDTPGGYEQVASAIYLSPEEFEGPNVLARRVAEALGCTEDCGAVSK